METACLKKIANNLDPMRDLCCIVKVRNQPFKIKAEKVIDHNRVLVACKCEDTCAGKGYVVGENVSERMHVDGTYTITAPSSLDCQHLPTIYA